MPEVQTLGEEIGSHDRRGRGVRRHPRRQTAAKRTTRSSSCTRTDGSIRRGPPSVYLVPFVEAVPFRVVLGPLLSGRGGWARWLAGGFRCRVPKTRCSRSPGRSWASASATRSSSSTFSAAFRNAGAQVQAVDHQRRVVRDDVLPGLPGEHRSACGPSRTARRSSGSRTPGSRCSSTRSGATSSGPSSERRGGPRARRRR